MNKAEDGDQSAGLNLKQISRYEQMQQYMPAYEPVWKKRNPVCWWHSIYEYMQVAEIIKNIYSHEKLSK